MADSGYLYIGESAPPDVVSQVDAADGLEDSNFASASGAVSGLFHDGVDLWEWDKADRNIRQRSGITATILNTYDFSGNSDVNSANAFIGAHVGGGHLYAGNFTDDAIIRTVGLNATTDVALDVSAYGAGAITCFCLDRYGNLIIANHSTNVLSRFKGFSTTLDAQIDLDNIGALGTIGTLFGVAVTDNNDTVIVDQGSPTARLIWLEGFAESLHKAITAEANWDVNPQAVSASGVLRDGTGPLNTNQFRERTRVAARLGWD